MHVNLILDETVQKLSLIVLQCYLWYLTEIWGKTCVFSEPHRLKEVIFSSNFPFHQFLRAPRCLCSTLPLELELAAPCVVPFWHAVSNLAAQTILVWQKTFLDWNSSITALSRWESCFLFLAYSTSYIEQKQILTGGGIRRRRCPAYTVVNGV